jgi:hypothetical protein
LAFAQFVVAIPLSYRGVFVANAPAVWLGR